MTPRHASIEDVMGRRLGPKEGVPFTLHVDGPLSLPLPSPRIAVVGMRKPTPGGLDRAGLYAESLARNGVLVVGGLARGIDAAAHVAAINAGGKTVAVLGTPLDASYPPENAALQEEIRKGHMIMSQFASGAHIKPVNFTARNRTMALIADASLIIEVGGGGGTMSHAWEAVRMGRPVFFDRAALKSNTYGWQRRMMQYGARVVPEPGDLLPLMPKP